MFKFLLYVLLFYIIFRYVFGSLFGNRTIHYSQHTHYHQQPPNAEEEGKITVDPRVKQKSGTDKLGEYVDFEEVKE